MARTLPANFDYGEQDTGWEDTDLSEMQIPFLNILQSNSPEVENEDPSGAKPGMLFNSVTRELFDGKQGVVFIPCHKQGPVYVEWIPRNRGGGYVGIHEATSEAVTKATPVVDQETGRPTRRLRHGDNELIETNYVYGHLLNEKGDESIGIAALSFTSTKLKPYRSWMTALWMQRPRPPIFANRARIVTVKEERPAGTYYNYRIAPFDKTWAASLINPNTHEALLAEAQELRESVVSGQARAAFETVRTEVTDGSGGQTASTDDPPF